MKTKIGGGEISPHLFSLSHERFLAALPKGFKRVLLPGLSDTEINAELTKLYVENGGIITETEAEASGTGTATNSGRNPKRTGVRDNNAKSAAVSQG